VGSCDERARHVISTYRVRAFFIRTPATILQLAVLAILGLVLLALAIPAARALDLIETHGGDAIAAPSHLPIRSVGFTAIDGVSLRGWLLPGKSGGPAVILVPGFLADRMSMLPYARFLHAAGFNVLLYDSRSTGQSGGSFSFGVREVDDVLGAIDFVTHAPLLHAHRIGLLGVSLGAGDAIVAAARDRRVAAVVADSPYTDQSAEVSGLDHLHVGPVEIPLVPDAPWVIDRLDNVTISSFRPIDAIASIPPRGILLIHARDDTNPTTPLSAALALRRASTGHAVVWVAPRGGHAEALAAQRAEYRRRVVQFLRRYLGR
jgi:dipeptidyl aminopeptidase/acylaminoacyl peptidase